MNLVSGGIYTVNNQDDLYYVFIEQDDTHLWFFHEQVNPSGLIQDWLNFNLDFELNGYFDYVKLDEIAMINDNNSYRFKDYLLRHIAHIKPEKFQKRVDGYLGTIKPELSDMLSEFLDENKHLVD